MDETNLCWGCMEPLPQGESVCPRCGYDKTAARLSSDLEPGSKIDGRYLIGKRLKQNGEGITYLGLDLNFGCKVLVREYLPLQLCSRVAGSPLVNVAPDHLAQYKALMIEYTELNKALAKQRGLSHLNPALDLISENNTTYAVYEYLEGRTLLTYLRENAGELSWKTVRRIFPPLFTTLSILHNAGILHRALSPDTIFVTKDGELKLSGFCISAVRTGESELEAELYDGYAAPEQYGTVQQQGTWTDVYGISAVLYRILTGCRATDAPTRMDYDSLVPPADINPEIPKGVSDAIMRGMALESAQRIPTVTDLVTELFEGTEEPPRAAAPRRAEPVEEIYEEPPVREPAPREREDVYAREGEEEAAAQPSVFERIRAPILIAVLFFAIVTIVVLVFLRLLNRYGDQPLDEGNRWSSMEGSNVVTAAPADSSSVPDYDSIMPQLVGMNFQIKKDAMAGWLELEPEYVFSEEYRKDTIVEQEIEEGTPFMSGSTVKVKVSKGSSKIAIPDFYGCTLDTYLTKLEDLGFEPAREGDDYAATTKRTWGKPATTSATTTAPVSGKRVIYKAKVDYHYANGNVCGVEPEVGTIVDVMEDYEIIVYYASNPVYTYSTSSTSSTSSTRYSWSASTTSTTTKAAVTEAPAVTQPPATEAPATQAPAVTQAPMDNNGGAQ